MEQTSWSEMRERESETVNGATAAGLLLFCSFDFCAAQLSYGSLLHNSVVGIVPFRVAIRLAKSAYEFCRAAAGTDFCFCEFYTGVAKSRFLISPARTANGSNSEFGCEVLSGCAGLAVWAAAVGLVA